MAPQRPKHQLERCFFMAKIYLVRHGESVANTKGIYQGQTYNTPLSAMGEKQAVALANHFEKINVERVLASPLKRTKQTAQGVALLKKIPLIEEYEIIETNHGEWEGLTKKVIEEKWPNVYQLWLTRPAETEFPGGETFRETEKRIIQWWNRMVAENKDTLIVTHDNIIRIIVAKILGIPLNNIWQFQLHPAAVTTVEVNGQGEKLLNLNDKGHLNNLIADLGKHAL